MRRWIWAMAGLASLGATTALADTSGQLVGIGGLCLDVPGGKPEPYAAVAMAPCSGAPAQQWTLATDGTVRGLGGLCLDVTYVNPNDGTALVLYPCHAGSNQRWTLSTRATLVGLANKCLDVEGGQIKAGTRAILWSCHGRANQQWRLVPWLPPAPPPNALPPAPLPTAGPVTFDVDAGPIWHQAHAQQRCPSVCAPAQWNGQWRTVVAGQRSLCGCVQAQTLPPQPMNAPPQPVMAQPQPVAVQPAPPQPVAVQPQPVTVQPAPPQPLPAPLQGPAYGAFLQRVRAAAFPQAMLAAIQDQVRVGSRFTCQQVIEVMRIVNFPDTQVKAASILWPNVLDRERAPEVVASLTFESHRQQLRKNLGL
jgi:hypothetical protein